MSKRLCHVRDLNKDEFTCQGKNGTRTNESSFAVPVVKTCEYNLHHKLSFEQEREISR